MLGYINFYESIFLYVTSHIYLSMWLHFTETDYFSFAFMINLIYFTCLIFYYSYKIGWKIANQINYYTNQCKF